MENALADTNGNAAVDGKTSGRIIKTQMCFLIYTFAQCVNSTSEVGGIPTRTRM